jgi:hypothetical protein
VIASNCLALNQAHASAAHIFDAHVPLVDLAVHSHTAPAPATATATTSIAKLLLLLAATLLQQTLLLLLRITTQQQPCAC